MRFVYYEIKPVKDYGEFCEVVPPEEADFWSLYGRDEQGLAWCIGDFSTESAAQNIKDAIEASK